ncbi:MAG TPA: tRNA dihydrouridine synthase DusB, partial [Candidatus Deferrimicrobium sp.]|nr:tRNA dihydrouridine synthase DusB [Candidatus Deferrimicrobium sp.]
MAIAAPARPSLRIGSLELRSPVLIAPMAGITDAPCRELTVEMGAGLVCTEMVASEAVVRSQQASLQLLDFPRGIGPAGAQLVGCDAAVMADAAQVCVARGAVSVDVNLGCPVKKVVGRGSGAALARDVRATTTVLRAMVDAVDVPVTAKMRLGWDAQSINAPELARALADAGVAAVTVHGRTRCQGYAGEADWREIARVKEAVDIPVIGSGDVDDVRLIEQRIRDGVVDGVVIARGMLGNFWLVRQATQLLATGELLADLDFAARIELCRRHLAMLVAYHGPQRALRTGRKYVAWSIKGCN